jgi:cell division protein FtsB
MMKSWERSWKYILSVIGIVVLVLLIWDFNDRMAQLHRLTSEKDLVGAQTTQLVQTNAHLETQIAYATSETAVEEWAREDQRMEKPGDIPVVPLAPVNSTPVPTPTPAVTPKVVDNWELWMGLFFNTNSP